MEVKLLQLEKHNNPNLVTDDGIVMEVNPLQSEKHCCPSVVTEEGIVIDFNDVGGVN